MEETKDGAGETGGGSSTGATRTRRKSPAGSKRAAAGTRKAPARRKTAPSARRAPRKKPASLEGLLRDFSKRASKAGAGIVSFSEDGIESAKKAMGQAGAASRSTIDRLTREWKKMDAKKRAQFAAGLLAALAAASAPIVRSSMKKK
ncbi:MAG TPA: hypothetical protein VE007_01050 [Thermoanaerobaculia bacterium]|nr:hypothetical protein [Thermoanaerobaculia bacterium]